ncbi:hypothetical protein [Shewanella inventionis]|uniref:Lipoprotein n=1 Tax=Shewanella inventionis TaxID=1738770 RepID=A0ABQ1IXK4_9GAMM|nr:hypothetical protein [Shewanella inventionis]MCL1157086.1 hypothetical protein [Shewanella inventionis]GGB55095.1 hypothetical protein GCM10011607_14580 [Shewanella inventionis]
MKILFTCFALVLTGCASTYSPVPENYQGEISKIDSSEKRHSNGKSDLFYLSKVNGKEIYNTLSATRNATYGQGFNLTTELLKTDVPSQEATFNIIGRTEHAAPMQAFADKVYEVKGNIVFKPEPNKEYIVKGILGESYSAVWIELKDTGEVIKNKIEVNGSAELGFFEK